MNWNSFNGCGNGCGPSDLNGGGCHTHEYCGSTRIAEAQTDPHNHRFCGVTGPAIPAGNTHCHRLTGLTDFFEDHCHRTMDTTGPAIPVGNGRHVHFSRCATSVDDGHRHNYMFATQIENPIGNC